MALQNKLKWLATDVEKDTLLEIAAIVTEGDTLEEVSNHIINILSSSVVNSAPQDPKSLSRIRI
jgi:hypothetical protein